MRTQQRTYVQIVLSSSTSSLRCDRLRLASARFRPETYAWLGTPARCIPEISHNNEPHSLGHIAEQPAQILMLLPLLDPHSSHHVVTEELLLNTIRDPRRTARNAGIPCRIREEDQMVSRPANCGQARRRCPGPLLRSLRFQPGTLPHTPRHKVVLTSSLTQRSSRMSSPTSSAYMSMCRTTSVSLIPCRNRGESG